MRLRDKLFKKVESLSTNEIKKFSINSLITRTTNDITQVEMVMGMGLQLLIKAPITAIWAITKILNKSWQWSAITAVAVVILLSVIISLMLVVVPRFKIVQKLIDKINGVIRENLTGIRVVRAFNAESYQEEKFNMANNELTKQQLFNQKRFAILSPIMYLVMNSLTLAIYFVGSYLIRDALMVDKISLFGDMVVFSSYAMQVIMSFLMLAMIFMMIPRAQVSASRINEVMDTEVSVIDGKLVECPTNEIGTVEFKNVSFKYPDAEEYLLKNISFKAQKGETVAFIGSTGSGKSTLINLIPRFYDVTEGEVLVDGVNVKEYKQEVLYNKLGYVPQKAVIFDGSVTFNVGYGDNGKEKTDDQIKEAIKVAQAREFVEKMDDRYDSHLSASGTNISGGQKQRISIARAIARNPEIYIFDDSFSALDYKTDSLLRHELKKYTKDATSLIVAQRIGTIMNADKILVLDNGFCVGMGTHEELLKNCEVYKEIALSQLSKEELEHGTK
jgi:ATP-binding cassette subfamily B protein